MFWGAAAAALLLALAAALAEHRRSKCRDLDRPGWVPWNLIQILALLAAISAVALALHL